MALLERTAASIYEYFDAVIADRQVCPGDDIISSFLETEVDGTRLSREDILDICFLFLVAGLDTVSASLDCMMLHLALHPDRRRALVEDPSLIPNAVEELLRWESPVMMVARLATRGAEIAGCPVRKGQVVTALLGAANTDEAAIPDPDVVRFDRDMNRHIAFGRGIHRCLGSHLARMELRVALREWHARIPDYRVPPGFQPAFTTSIRSLGALPLLLGQSALRQVAWVLDRSGLLEDQHRLGGADLGDFLEPRQHHVAQGHGVAGANAQQDVVLAGDERDVIDLGHAQQLAAHRLPGPLGDVQVDVGRQRVRRPAPGR